MPLVTPWAHPPIPPQFLADFQAYLLNAVVAEDGRHNAIPNILYWVWNPNSLDTGGLVDLTMYNLQWV